MAYVVDTNIFNMIADGTLSKDELPSNAPLVVTHVQLDEIVRTKDEDRRAHLLAVFKDVATAAIPTATFIAGYSQAGMASVSNGTVYNAIRRDLDALNNSKRSNFADALIAEATIANRCTLLTADRDLADVTEKHHGTVHRFHWRG